MERVLKELINDGAEQIKLFLDLDQLATSAVAEDIIKEDDISKKLSKFIHLVIDRLKFQRNPDKYYDDFIVNIIKTCSDNIPNVPESPQEFASWLPEHLLKHRTEIKTMKRRLIECQKTLFDTQKEIANYTQEQTFKDSAHEEKIKNLVEEVNILKEKCLENEETKNNLHMKTIMEEQNRTKAESTIRKLNEENTILANVAQCLRNKLKNYKKQINLLKIQLDSSSEKVSHVKLDKKAIKHELDYIENSASKIRKLQELNCNCFKDCTDWVTTHLKLHRRLEQLLDKVECMKCRIADLQRSNKELAKTNEFFRSMNKPAICSGRCINNEKIKAKFAQLENDVRALKQELM